MNKIFLEKIAIFDIDIVVCVGSKLEDWEKWMKKVKFSESFLKDYKYIRPQIQEGFKILHEANNGCMACIKNEEGVNYYFLLLKKWEYSSQCYDTLLHEIVHLKQFLWEAKAIEKEIEFEAYFIENVFIQLRDKLNKLFICQKKNKK